MPSQKGLVSFQNFLNAYGNRHWTRKDLTPGQVYIYQNSARSPQIKVRETNTHL